MTIVKKAVILAVDDDTDNLILLVNILKHEYTVKVANGGYTALEIIKNKKDERPDLILLDVMMPDIDGLTICKQLKTDSLTSEVPIIFLTGKNDIGDQAAGLQLGAVDYITKPIDPAIVLARVKNHIFIKTAQDFLKDKNMLLEEMVSMRTAELIAIHEKQKLLNQQVNQMQKVESLSRLTAGIAHDFNNILNAIIGYNQLNKFAGEDCTDQKLKEEIFFNTEQVELASERAINLIKKMMAYSRQNPINLEIKPTINVIDEVIAMVRPALTSRFELITHAETDMTIQIDSTELHQILTNLIVNARDAMPQGGVITVSLKQLSIKEHVCNACVLTLDGEFIELSISDNGSGIEKKVLEHIFDPFFTTKPLGEGTGLGLSTVSGMVHEAHGHIIVESNTVVQNCGATFRLLFPVLE